MVMEILHVGMKHSRSSAKYIYNMWPWSVWKGRKKDKDSPTQVQDEYHQYMEDEYVRDCSACDIEHLERLVTLPPNLSYDEWLATHTISFFEHINLLYGTVSEFCTASECASMTAPYNTQYTWLDEKGKKCKCPAPQYVDYVMSYIQKTIADESVFPTKFGYDFPTTIDTLVKKINKYLFQVIAHIYHAHFKEIVSLSLTGHINILLKHFMLFNRLHNLLDKDCDLLDDIVLALMTPRTPSSTNDASQETEAMDATSSEDKENDKSAENQPNHTPPSVTTSNDSTPSDNKHILATTT